MELTLTHKIQAQISCNRTRRNRTLGKLKNRNGAAQAGSVSQASSNSGFNRLVVRNSSASKYAPSLTIEQQCNQKFQSAGWVVRAHINDLRFRTENLNNRLVAFVLRDDDNNVEKLSGTLQQVGGTFSALFRLSGCERVFNANTVSFMAVQP